MKTKLLLIISFVVVLIGAGLIALGFYSGASTKLYVTNEGFVFSEYQNKETIYENKEDKINNVKIDVDKNNINFVKSNDFSVVSNNAEVEVELVGETILIKEKKYTFKEVSFDLFPTSEELEITINIPFDIELEEVEIEANFGDILFDDQNIDLLSVNLDKCNIFIKNSTIIDTNLEIDNGDIYLDNSTVSDLTSEINQGFVSIIKSEVEDIDIDLSLGNANIELTNDIEDYNFDLEAENITVLNLDENIDYNDFEGANTFKFKTSNGDIIISFS